MADETTTTGAPAHLTLQELTKWLRGQEASLGPVIAIGNNGEATAATFRFDLFEPTTPATIYLEDNASSALAGSVELCRGDVFVNGQVQDVVVYRDP